MNRIEQPRKDQLNQARENPVFVSGSGLAIADVMAAARRGRKARLSPDPAVEAAISGSREAIRRTMASGEAVYGVTTVFGGMANIRVPDEEAAALQNNIAWPHKTGAGDFLPDWVARAALLLRANSLARGVSGVRRELITRYLDCLNADICPLVREMGSIGASGDLVPLSHILGAAIGLDPVFRVRMGGKEMDCLSALAAAGLKPMSLEVKEGLSAINGTSVMTAIAAGAIHDCRGYLAVTLAVHALFAQALRAAMQSFHPFIQEHKPHPGQAACARWMRDLLDGSVMVRRTADGNRRMKENDLVQDRYSLRCLPQFLGPVADALAEAGRQVTVEINSAADNPLWDPDTGDCFFCGNFLGQYIGTSMDRLRHIMGMTAKHLDTQIALLVAPEFNGGLPPSLVGNPDRTVNIGLKGLQLSANSIMPLLLFYGNSLADRFPTHAEQFNQNVNSQGFGSAVLTLKSLDIFRRYLAISLIFGVQAVDLRCRAVAGHFDARKMLSPATAAVYEAVKAAAGVRPGPGRPYVYDDDEQALDGHIDRISEDLSGEEGRIMETVKELIISVGAHDGAMISGTEKKEAR